MHAAVPRAGARSTARCGPQARRARRLARGAPASTCALSSGRRAELPAAALGEAGSAPAFARQVGAGRWHQELCTPAVVIAVPTPMQRPPCQQQARL